MSLGAGVLARFCVVGSLGFGVDAALTLLLTQAAGWNPAPSRLVAFLIAATVTWALNRRFTFRSTLGVSTWTPYVLFTSIGAAINIVVFLGWIWVTSDRAVSVFTGVALGSASALVFNFFAAKAIFAEPNVSR